MQKLTGFFSAKRTVLLWVAAVVVAVGGGTAAVAAAGEPNRDVLTQNDVRQQLDDSSSTAPGASPSTGGSSAAPEGRGDRHTQQTKGGWVAFRCSGATVFLESWSPKPGYRADDVRRGPGQRASVEFESDTSNDVKVVVTCDSSGTPGVTVHEEYDDHGGDDHGGDDHGGDDNRGRGGDDRRGRDHPEDD